MDPLSITTGVLSVLGVCLKVSVELKKFRDAANEGKATATAMLVDLSALRRVLQSMEEIFDQLDVEAIATGCIGTHWQNLLTSLRDGHDALEQFETLLQNCNKEVVVLDRARRAIRLKEAADSIAEFRQQIQSYKDTLQISVQTVILWSSLSVQVSTAQMLPNLAAIQTDMRRLATNLDIKLQAIEELSKTSDKEAQSRKVTNLKNCVRSAATVLSSASTVASMHEQDPSQVIDDHMSEIESVWIQPEALEATRSWVSKQAKDSSWEDWSEELTTAEDNTKDEDSMRANAASNTLALESHEQGLSNQSLENVAEITTLGSDTGTQLAELPYRWLIRSEEPFPKSKRRLVAQLLHSKVPRGKSRPIDIADSKPEKPAKTPLRRKLVFVGDGTCGKSHFLVRLSKGYYPNVYCGTVFDNYYISASNGEHEFEIDIYDTSGIDEYDELRPLSYPDTHAVCICFSINSPDSLENLQDKWIREILHFCPNVPIFLLGLKEDLRDDQETIHELRKTHQRPIDPKHGEEVRKRIGAVEYLESSAKTGFGVQQTGEAILDHLIVVEENKASGLRQPRTRNGLRALFS